MSDFDLTESSVAKDNWLSLVSKKSSYASLGRGTKRQWTMNQLNGVTENESENKNE